MDITAILQQRDRQSFNCLYDRYANMLFGTIRRMVDEHAIAERVLVETFVEAWKSLDEFDGKSSDIFIWMLRIARAKANGYIRPGERKASSVKKVKMGFGRTRFMIE